MKKLLLLVLAVTCVFGLAGCNSKKIVTDDKTDASFIGNANETETFFVGKVVEINETTMIVEVTNKGNCGVSVGDQVSVSTKKISGVLGNDPSVITDNYVRIEFNGDIMETYPLQLGDVFRIDVTNAEGIAID